MANTSKLVDVLNAAGVPVSPLLETLGTIVSEAKTVIDKVFQSQPAPWTWSKMWEELYALRDQIYAESQKILSPQEFKVLLTLVSTAGKGAWLVTEKLIRAISEKDNLEKAQVEQAVRSLIQKGLLKEGISLAI